MGAKLSSFFHDAASIYFSACTGVIDINSQLLLNDIISGLYQR